MPRYVRLLPRLLLLALSIPAWAAPAGQVVRLETRPGIQQPFILIEPEHAVATVLLFPGYGGYIDVQQGAEGPTTRSQNFLVRSRQLFAAQGLRVAVMDAPSDRHYVEGMLHGFRYGDKHVTDIAAVIDWLKARSDQPVWLVGTSRGTESATQLTIKLPERVDGLVLSSPISKSNNMGTAVQDMDLEKIRQPVLIAVHLNDACHVTPSYGAVRIRDGLTAAAAVEIAEFDGGEHRNSDTCGPTSAHGFLGIEAEVVQRIAAFIRNH